MNRWTQAVACGHGKCAEVPASASKYTKQDFKKNRQHSTTAFFSPRNGSQNKHLFIPFCELFNTN